MTADKSTAILELLASKICHDLISPIGAVNNGIEILEDMGPDAGPDVTELIAFSAGQASSKLKAYRLAYGAGGADANLKPEDIYKALAQLLPDDAKIKQNWDPHKDLKMDEYPKAYCKILICLLMVAMECLPKGGRISAYLKPDGATCVRGENDSVQMKDPLREALSCRTPLDALDPRYVHAYMTGLLASYHGYKISIAEASESSVEFRFEPIAA